MRQVVSDVEESWGDSSPNRHSISSAACTGCAGCVPDITKAIRLGAAGKRVDLSIFQPSLELLDPTTWLLQLAAELHAAHVRRS